MRERLAPSPMGYFWYLGRKKNFGCEGENYASDKHVFMEFHWKCLLIKKTHCHAVIWEKRVRGSGIECKKADNKTEWRLKNNTVTRSTLS